MGCLKYVINRDSNEENNYKKELKNKNENYSVLDEKKINEQNKNENIKKQSNHDIYEIITNSEYDETKGLNINYLDNFVNSIFPDDFPNKYIETIKLQFFDIKKNIGNQNQIKYLIEFKEIKNNTSFFFICGVKKIDENTINIAYKFKILDIKIQKVGEKISIKDKESEEMFNKAIEIEKEKLRQKLIE